MVVATLALVMATTGTGIAATKYSITSSKQVKDGSISLSDLSKSARKSLRGKTGPRGSAGLAGAPGAPGSPGATGQRGPSDAHFISGIGLANAVTLPAGQFVLTGDVYFGAGANMECTAWHASSSNTGGKTSYARGGGFTWNVPVSDAFALTTPGKAYVTCIGGGNSAVRPDVSVIQVGSLTP
jgi:hypothetical protein